MSFQPSLTLSSSPVDHQPGRYSHLCAGGRSICTTPTIPHWEERSRASDGFAPHPPVAPRCRSGELPKLSYGSGLPVYFSKPIAAKTNLATGQAIENPPNL